MEPVRKHRPRTPRRKGAFTMPRTNCKPIPILTPRQRMGLFSRVHVNTTTGCWEWIGPLTGVGYSQISLGRSFFLAHRVMYTEFRGPIPGVLTIDHLCRNKRCINPWHMEAVTHAENNFRGNSNSARKRRQTHCNQGHEFTPENTYIHKNGNRACRECNRLRAERRRNKSSPR